MPTTGKHRASSLAQPQVSTATQARLPVPHHYTAVEIIVPLQARTLSFVQANAYDNSYRKRAAFLITFFTFLPIPLAQTMSFNTINMSGTTIRRRKKKITRALVLNPKQQPTVVLNTRGDGVTARRPMRQGTL